MNIVLVMLIALILLVVSLILVIVLEKFDVLSYKLAYKFDLIMISIMVVLAFSLFACIIIAKIIPAAYTDYTVLKTAKLYEESNKIYYEDPDTKTVKFIDLSDETVKFTTEESHVEYINAKWLIFTEDFRVIYIHKD